MSVLYINNKARITLALLQYSSSLTLCFSLPPGTVQSHCSPLLQMGCLCAYHIPTADGRACIGYFEVEGVWASMVSGWASTLHSSMVSLHGSMVSLHSFRVSLSSFRKSFRTPEQASMTAGWASTVPEWASMASRWATPPSWSASMLQFTALWCLCCSRLRLHGTRMSLHAWLQGKAPGQGSRACLHNSRVSIQGFTMSLRTSTSMAPGWASIAVGQGSMAPGWVPGLELSRYSSMVSLHGSRVDLQVLNVSLHGSTDEPLRHTWESLRLQGEPPWLRGEPPRLRMSLHSAKITIIAQICVFIKWR